LLREKNPVPKKCSARLKLVKRFPNLSSVGIVVMDSGYKISDGTIKVVCLGDLDTWTEVDSDNDVVWNPKDEFDPYDDELSEV
jgi:hypothetical protein